MDKIRTYRDLRVYQQARSSSMSVFRLVDSFPRKEMFGLTSQILRSSRSVRANLAEAWRRRRYHAAFVAKLTDVMTEATETQEWLHTAADCGYIEEITTAKLVDEYEHIIAQVIKMADNPKPWLVTRPKDRTE